jgi:hypothetical protein
VQNTIKNADISIARDQPASALKYMKEGLLEGWCWQSTNTLSVLFNDPDVIARGSLDIRLGNYEQSWIEFNRSRQDFVLDPALNILSSKKNYYESLNAEKRHEVSAAMAKKALLELANGSDQEVYIAGTNDPTDPFFRMNSNVAIQTNGKKIRKIKSHFYYNG